MHDSRNDPKHTIFAFGRRARSTGWHWPDAVISACWYEKVIRPRADRRRTSLNFYYGTIHEIFERSCKDNLRRAGYLLHILLVALAKGGAVNALSAAGRIVRREGPIALLRALRRTRVEALARSAVFTPGLIGRIVYGEWIRQFDTLNDDTRAKIRRHIATLRHKPLISVVMPVYNPLPKYLDQAIQSVREQLYPHWELCIADDASTDRHIQRVIAEHAQSDSRINVVTRGANGHICRATNSALELAQGEFVAFLDHDDIIAEHALYWIAAALERKPDTDILYSDSDNIDDAGERSSPYFKPDFNLELMLGQNMINHLGVYRRSLVQAVEGMRAGLEGSQDYDLFLRILAKSAAERVLHIPTVLYHWRRSKDAPSFSVIASDRCVRAARKAVDDFLNAKGLAADVLPAPRIPIFQRIRYHLPNPEPKVSVIISANNQTKSLSRYIERLLTATDYPSFDVTIVDNDSGGAEAVEFLAERAKRPRVRVISNSGPFNSAATDNFAVGQTGGDILFFLHGGIEITQSDWLREMASHAARPEVGAVGAMLHTPNGNVQHAGIVTGLGIDRIAGHFYFNVPSNYIGLFGQLFLTREVSAVTSACMAVRRSVFLEAGGLDESHLPNAYYDVDFCLRLRDLGYKNIVTPFVGLVHHEPTAHGSDQSMQKSDRFPQEVEYMKRRWADELLCDPYFNPNLSLNSAIPDLARPPRLAYPWDA